MKTFFFFILIKYVLIIGTEIDTCINILFPSYDSLNYTNDALISGNTTCHEYDHIWLFLHRIDFKEVWWPQCEVQYYKNKGNWKGRVFLGRSADIGYAFEIIAVAVNRNIHEYLLEYIDKSLKNNDWQPINMPAIEAKSKRRILIKIDHLFKKECINNIFNSK